ncbi:hypothetical protein BVRB_3g059170 [Beta vulgaris subsp. vulgaris]|nr:hypothetical protein BVRB_3g059170 [Beta vulgaris subsp. vulgaris]
MVFMVSSSHINKLCIISLLLLVLAKSNVAYNVVSFGARPDGRTDSTQAFRKAWASACLSVKPAILDVPWGRFVVQPIFFSGPCRASVTLRMKGTIIGPSDYRVLARSSVWLMFYNVNGLVIHGGILDARGHSFWSCRRRFGYCYNGAQSISFTSCNNVVVRGLTSLNSQKSHMSIKNSNNVALQYLRLRAPSGSPNTDGMNIQHSNRVSVYNSAIMTGDDCIAIGPGTQNMVVNKIACGPGHGISIGSMGNSLRENGVQNIVVSNVVFTKTTFGARIKSWARPSNSFVRGITFRNLIMRSVYYPILIDQKYCPNNQCPHQELSEAEAAEIKAKMAEEMSSDDDTDDDEEDAASTETPPTEQPAAKQPATGPSS